MIVTSKMPPEGLLRLGDIDRSEHITAIYVVREGELDVQPVDIRAAAWSPSGDGPDSLARNIAEWTKWLDDGGSLFGALDGERLAGLAIYVPNLRPRLAELALLHVSRPFRKLGVGRKLVEEVIAAARSDGADRICVSATETLNTVDFYRGLGFELELNPVPELVELEPDDIQLSLTLQ